MAKRNKQTRQKIGYELRVWRDLGRNGTAAGWERCGLFPSKAAADSERQKRYASAPRFTIMGVRIDTSPLAAVRDSSDRPAQSVR